jgi:tRNA threonylcarbamoyladenosine biosynthesis protein TsaB
MIVLALDTTTRAGSVALAEDDRVVDERPGDAARSHAERLPRELLAVLDAHGVALAAVDVFAVASGPGSFTGLRIGIATIQGLALVGRRQVVGVAALDALAHMAARDHAAGTTVAAWMDAHRQDVFAALYRVTEAPPFEPARLVPLDPPSVEAPASVLARWRSQSDAISVFIGDGAVRFRDHIAAAHPSAAIVEPPALAGAVGRLAIAAARRGLAIDPAGIRPLYVRRPDAEIDREKRALTTSEATDTKW